MVYRASIPAGILSYRNSGIKTGGEISPATILISLSEEPARDQGAALKDLICTEHYNPEPHFGAFWWPQDGGRFIYCP